MVKMRSCLAVLAQPHEPVRRVCESQATCPSLESWKRSHVQAMWSLTQRADRMVIEGGKVWIEEIS